MNNGEREVNESTNVNHNAISSFTEGQKSSKLDISGSKHPEIENNVKESIHKQLNGSQFKNYDGVKIPMKNLTKGTNNAILQSGTSNLHEKRKKNQNKQSSLHSSGGSGYELYQFQKVDELTDLNVPNQHSLHKTTHFEKKHPSIISDELKIQKNTIHKGEIENDDHFGYQIIPNFDFISQKTNVKQIREITTNFSHPSDKLNHFMYDQKNSNASNMSKLPQNVDEQVKTPNKSVSEQNIECSDKVFTLKSKSSEETIVNNGKTNIDKTDHGRSNSKKSKKKKKRFDPNRIHVEYECTLTPNNTYFVELNEIKQPKKQKEDYDLQSDLIDTTNLKIENTLVKTEIEVQDFHVISMKQDVKNPQFLKAKYDIYFEFFKFQAEVPISLRARFVVNEIKLMNFKKDEFLKFLSEFNIITLDELNQYLDWEISKKVKFVCYFIYFHLKFVARNPQNLVDGPKSQPILQKGPQSFSTNQILHNMNILNRTTNKFMSGPIINKQPTNSSFLGQSYSQNPHIQQIRTSPNALNTINSPKKAINNSQMIFDRPNFSPIMPGSRLQQGAEKQKSPTTPNQMKHLKNSKKMTDDEIEKENTKIVDLISTTKFDFFNNHYKSIFDNFTLDQIDPVKFPNFLKLLNKLIFFCKEKAFVYTCTETPDRKTKYKTDKGMRTIIAKNVLGTFIKDFELKKTKYLTTLYKFEGGDFDEKMFREEIKNLFF